MNINGNNQKQSLYESEESDETDEESPRKFIDNDERRCKFCGHLLKNVSGVAKHELKCKVALTNTEDLIVTKKGKNCFICKICFRTFKFLSGLSKHKLRHEMPGGFICKLCDEKFCSNQELQKHKEDTHKAYMCKLCKSTFNSEDKYANHIIEDHDGRDRVYVICEDCGTQFKTQTVLSYHRQSLCGTTKPFKCDECGSFFRNQWSLKNHLLIHKGEKKFLCSYCENSFICKAQLINHERKHTKEKPFTCSVCSKAFSHRESLVTHSSIHTGIKPYICEACGACFSCIGNLHKHRRKRPNTCGLPQYNPNAKTAPRPSIKSGRLTMNLNNAPKVPKCNVVFTKNTEAPKNDDKQRQEKSLSIDKNSIKEDKNSIKEDKNSIKEDKNSIKEDKNSIKEDKNSIKEDKNSIKEDKNSIKEVKNTTDREIQIKPSTEQEKSFKNELHEMSNEEVDSIPVVISPENNVFSENQSNNEEIIVVLKSDCKEEKDKKNFGTNSEFEIYHIKVIQSDEESNDYPDYYENNSPNDVENDDDHKKNEDVKNDKEDIENDKREDELVCEQNNTIHNLKTEDIQTPLISPNDMISSEDDDENIPLSKLRQKIRENNKMVLKINSIKKENNNTSIKKKKKRNDRIPRIVKCNFYECDECPKVYHQRKSFVKHLISFHKKTPVDAAMLLDRKEITEENFLRCKYCGKAYYRKTSLKKHEMLHGPLGKLLHKCSCCRLYFPTPEKAIEHAKYEHAEVLTCGICHKFFFGIDAIAVHRRDAHKVTKNELRTGKVINVCQKCGKTFLNKTALNDHERSNCGKNPQYECSLCQKRFHSAGALKTHGTLHTGIKPYKCSYCSKLFRTYGQVKVHERKHNGIKPYKCDVCDKSFSYRESLLTHSSIHSGIKRYSCNGCGTQFSCISNLQNHRRTNVETCGSLPLQSKPVAPAGVNRGILYIGKKSGS